MSTKKTAPQPATKLAPGEELIPIVWAATAHGVEITFDASVTFHSGEALRVWWGDKDGPTCKKVVAR